jgi:hypothetical protein
MFCATSSALAIVGHRGLMPRGGGDEACGDQIDADRRDLKREIGDERGHCNGRWALPVPLHYDSKRRNNDSASGGSKGVGADSIDSDAKAIVRDDLR